MEINEQLQHIFEDGLKHMREQGHCSLSILSEDTCVYFNDETGSKCFFGSLIEPEYYTKGLEGMTANCGPVLLALTKSGYPSNLVDASILANMQDMLHDDLKDSEDFRNDLDFNAKELAESFDLEYKDEDN